MGLARRKFLHLTAGVAALAGSSRLCAAEADFPNRRVRLIIGYPAGIQPDVIARIVVPAIGEQLGQPVVVENRPGAGTNLGTEFVVRATADGYTLLLVPVATAAANATLYSKLKFNFIRDIMPVASIGGSPLVLVATPSLPATTIPEFIAYAKSHPGQINMASTGVGTAPDLAGELFNMMAGVKLVNVAFRTNFMQDLVGGQVQVSFPGVLTVAGPALREPCRPKGCGRPRARLLGPEQSDFGRIYVIPLGFASPGYNPTGAPLRRVNGDGMIQ
jgi:tripartite-type tricarboxylate transporter receptor subunit TctC